MNDDANKVLMGGGGPPACSFPTIGTTASGRILEVEPPSQQTTPSGENKVWPDGKPMMQVVVVLQTDERHPDRDDDGKRRLFIKGHMIAAVREAVKGAGCDGIAQGGILAVQYTSDGKSSAPGMNPPKYFRAQYKAPAVAVDDLIPAGGNGAEPAAEQLTADDLLPGA